MNERDSVPHLDMSSVQTQAEVSVKLWKLVKYSLIITQAAM